jgi:hypothetical protein
MKRGHRYPLRSAKSTNVPSQNHQTIPYTKPAPLVKKDVDSKSTKRRSSECAWCDGIHVEHLTEATVIYVACDGTCEGAEALRSQVKALGSTLEYLKKDQMEKILELTAEVAEYKDLWKKAVQTAEMLLFQIEAGIDRRSYLSW